MRVLPMGDRAVLVEHPRPTPATWSNAFRSLGLDGVVDVVPAADTVLVRCADPAALGRVIADLDRVLERGEPDATTEPGEDGEDGRTVTIPVRYDGADLDEVGERAGLSAAEVIELHAGAHYRVAFCGFAPGFAYLDGLPELLWLPRRSTPRTSVPTGSVAIAARHSAVYPAESPGGWHLLGTTGLALWDLTADPPARLVPGTSVRFEPR